MCLLFPRHRDYDHRSGARGIDGVQEVYSVSGEWDLVVIVKVPEYQRIAEVVTEKFPAVKGIERTQTLTAFRAYSRNDLEQAWDIGVT
jgi:DNA-binding Lrp family transcriptional regulator